MSVHLYHAVTRLTGNYPLTNWKECCFNKD